MQVPDILRQVLRPGVPGEQVNRRAEPVDEISVLDQIHGDHGLNVVDIIGIEAFELAHNRVDNSERLDLEMVQQLVEGHGRVEFRPPGEKG